MLIIIKRLLKLLPVFSLIFSACDPNHTDSYYYNSRARGGQVISVREVNFDNITPDMHFAGYLRVTFTPDTLLGRLYETHVYMDDNPIPFTTFNAEVNMEFYTPDYPEGQHDFKIVCKFTNPEIGLGIYIGERDSVVYHTSLYFDQTPPSVPVMLGASYKGDSIEVKWQPVNDANFYSYSLRGYSLVYDPDPWYRPRLERTFYDKDKNSFVDQPIEPIFGLTQSYRVIASNGLDTTTGNMVAIAYDPSDLLSWPLKDVIVSEPIFLKGGESFLNFTANGVQRLSYPEGNLLATGQWGFVNGVHGFSPDSLHMVIYYGFEFYIMSMVDLSIEKHFSVGEINGYVGIIWGSNDRILIGNVVIDPQSETIVQTMPVTFATLGISNDHRTGIGTWSFSDSLAMVDFSGDSVLITYSCDAGGRAWCVKFDPSDQNAFIIFFTEPANSSVHIYDGHNLTKTGQLPLPGGAYRNLLVTSSEIIVPYPTTGHNYSTLPGALTRYDRFSLLPKATYDFVYPPLSFVLSPDEKVLIVSTWYFFKPFFINMEP